jgi:hypothetical protein
VYLKRGDDADPRYARDWGWTPGTRHNVVFFGYAPNGNPIIGDPAVGREQWSPAALDKLWHGHGLRLVQK